MKTDELKKITVELDCLKETLEKQKKRNEILEKRCERYRTIIRKEVEMDRVDSYFDTGALSFNDARYLYELTELDVRDELFVGKQKQPLGVVSRDIWDRKRREELHEAIVRYLKAGKKIPEEWLDEYNEITVRLEGKK